MEKDFYFPDAESTPILRDFSIFTRHMSAHRVLLTKSNSFIPGKDLFEINKEMTWPATDTTVRTIQPIYIQLHFFYHITLAGKLFQNVAKGNQAIFEPTARLQIYEELKPAEKFFFLLETLWMDADWYKIGSGFGFLSRPDVLEVLNLLSKQEAGKEISLRYPECIDEMPEIAMRLSHWDYFLLYFSFFGFWSVKPDERAMKLSEYRRHFKAQVITPSAFGIQLARILNQDRDFNQWNKPIQQDYGLPFNINRKGKRAKTNDNLNLEPFFLPFQSILLPGELEKTLPRGNGSFVDGIYIFRMGLTSKTSKRIEIGANKTLLDLNDAIQDKFNLDDDHLFSFFMDGRLWSNNRFNSPDDLNGPYADDVRIGDLGLFNGQTILYLYDFGEMFELKVILEGIQATKTI